MLSPQGQPAPSSQSGKGKFLRSENALLKIKSPENHIIWYYKATGNTEEFQIFSVLAFSFCPLRVSVPPREFSSALPCGRHPASARWHVFP